MSKLAIFFPGIGYNCDRPLLYYARKLAVSCGYECRAVNYAYNGDMNIRGNIRKMEEAFKELYRQAEEILSDAEPDRYDEVLFISKSVGTVIAAAYAGSLREKGICDASAFRHVLYTPLEYTFKYDPQNAAAFLGTADPWCVPEEVVRIAKEHDVPMDVYGGADHSLETGDVAADLLILKDVMEKTESFMKKPGGRT
ncbi:MAG: alpha/beta hydrolase [Lachnospiraceae bacterium]|nr:alpha/beta hydrolase [Lachnospiraceae bacterium]